MRIISLAFAAILAVLAATPAQATDPSFTIIIRDHRFEPARIEVPAGQKLLLVVRNMDASSEEFESKDLKREKVIAGGKEATIIVGPLAAGTYRFVGEYHEDTAKGELVAK